MSPTNDDALPLDDNGDAGAPLSAAAFPGNRNTAGDVAAKWLAGMRRARKACVRPPWEEATWFEPPSIVRVTMLDNINPFQLVAGNPRRVGLRLHPEATAWLEVWPMPRTGHVDFNARGITIGPNTPLILTQAEWGPLVSAQWMGLTARGIRTWASPVGLAVVELVLRDWPQQS